MFWRSCMKSLILEGFMGCGKSRIAKGLAKKYNLELIDTDEIIEDEQKKRISDIFEDEGEEAFRDMETSLLKRLCKKEGPFVLSLGGGMPCREENRRLLKEIGTVVYLKASPEVLTGRLEKGVEKRPMLKGHDLKQRVSQLLTERRDAYEEAADVVMDIGLSDPDTIVSMIEKEFLL